MTTRIFTHNFSALMVVSFSMLSRYYTIAVNALVICFNMQTAPPYLDDNNKPCAARDHVLGCGMATTY